MWFVKEKLWLLLSLLSKLLEGCPLGPCSRPSWGQPWPSHAHRSYLVPAESWESETCLRQPRMKTLRGLCTVYRGFPGGTSSKESTCQCRNSKRRGVQSLSQEDPLEREMATHSSILAWKIPCRGAWWTTVQGVSVRHGSLSPTQLSVPALSMHAQCMEGLQRGLTFQLGHCGLRRC